MPRSTGNPEIRGSQIHSQIRWGAVLLVASAAAPRFVLGQATCPGSDAIVLDCNGNGTDDFCDLAAGTSADADTNGIPDECDTTQCLTPWSGFEPAPPFAVGAFLDGLDTDTDGVAWENPGLYWTLQNIGCPASQGKAIKGVASNPPVGDLLISEYFRTTNGRLDCAASIHSLTFDARYEAQLNPRIDWQMTLRDAVQEADVMLIHWASTQSNYPGVLQAQGGSGRGRILVRNPEGSPQFINTGFAIPANTCHQLQVVLNNITNTVELSINGVPRVTVARLEAGAAPIDRFLVLQAPNGQTSGGANRLALDNFSWCETGGRYWPDCDENCVNDAFDPDCNANGAPDACDIAAGTSEDCNGDGTPDGCEPDCNSNGSADPCELVGRQEYIIPVQPPIPISNSSPPATHEFEVAESGPIRDVDVGVTISHTDVHDLEIRVSHRGATVLLFDNQCGTEDNFSGTVWSDEAATAIACAAGHVGTFRPFSPLSAFDGLDASGPWTISVRDNLSGDNGHLIRWFLRLEGPVDCNDNAIPDECESLAPCTHIIAASSWREHGGTAGRDAIVINPAAQIISGGVTSEPRSGGISELRLALDGAPGGPGPSPVSIEQRTCGDGGDYVAYTGAALTATSIAGNELVLTFTPALENARTYRITLGSDVTAAPDQAIEVRALLGDVDSSGRVKATDRSLVIAVWTGGGYSAATDIDLSGNTDPPDRSLVVAAWTGTENCAP